MLFGFPHHRLSDEFLKADKDAYRGLLRVNDLNKFAELLDVDLAAFDFNQDDLLLFAQRKRHVSIPAAVGGFLRIRNTAQQKFDDPILKFQASFVGIGGQFFGGSDVFRDAMNFKGLANAVVFGVIGILQAFHDEFNG